ncbi:MAG: hypothetical protein MUF42_12920 [Cytophagaceae bacterium]|nr:hypothetical protein [Cytophagaceae bacterium]
MLEEVIFPQLQEVQSTFCLYMRSGLSVEMFRRLVEKQEKGIQVEVLVEQENSDYLRQDPFLHQLCVRLLQSGGSLMQVTCFEPVNAFLLCDYKKISFVSPSSVVSVFNEKDQRDYLIRSRRYVQGLKQKSQRLFRELSPIQVEFQLSTDFVKSGTPVIATWDVKGAAEVQLEGIGPVESKGSREIIFFENTIVKLVATHQKQVQAVTAYVRVYGDVEIQYDLGFLNPVTQQYSSLVNAENYPDVFGIMKGHSVQFSWEVLEADKVSIQPFDRSERKGELTFTPQQSMEIVINASGNNQESERVIHIRVFPVPVYAEKMVQVNPQWLQKEVKVHLPDQQTRLQKKSIKLIMQEADQRYVQLQQKMQHLSESGNVTDVDALQSLLLIEMKKKYSIKDQVKDYIDDFYKQLQSLKSKK